jgi:hypothetical protein
VVKAVIPAAGVVRLAAERPDLGPDLRGWLRGFVAGLPDEPAAEPRA